MANELGRGTLPPRGEVFLAGRPKGVDVGEGRLPISLGRMSIQNGQAADDLYRWALLDPHEALMALAQGKIRAGKVIGRREAAFRTQGLLPIQTMRGPIYRYPGELGDIGDRKLTAVIEMNKTLQLFLRYLIKERERTRPKPIEEQMAMVVVGVLGLLVNVLAATGQGVEDVS